eukprot:1989712-Amphidinium_carterae.1
MSSHSPRHHSDKSQMRVPPRNTLEEEVDAEPAMPLEWKPTLRFLQRLGSSTCFPTVQQWSAVHEPKTRGQPSTLFS